MTKLRVEWHILHNIKSEFTLKMPSEVFLRNDDTDVSKSYVSTPVTKWLHLWINIIINIRDTT